MKALSLAAVVLAATTGIASAQFEGTFGSNGKFGFDGTTGFSNCFSAGQGEAGVGGTNCSSGTVGKYSFGFAESITGTIQDVTQFETISQNSHSNGIQNNWQKSMGNGPVTKQGLSQVGNVRNTQSQTNSNGGVAVHGDIIRRTHVNFTGEGFTNTNSYFDSGMGTMCSIMAGAFTCNGAAAGNGGAD